MRVKPIVLAMISAIALSAAALAHEEMLEGSEWGVVGDDGESARYISFAGSGQVFGFGGCNRFTGTYEQHERITNRMGKMTDDIGRDAQLESLLRNRAKALGIEMTMGRDISQDLANSIGFGRGRGLGLGR